MVTSVGMPPNWEAIGRDKKGWVYRWRYGDSFVEHCDKRWYWYTGIKTKHMKENGAFTCPVACAVACELQMGGKFEMEWEFGKTETFRRVSSAPSYQNLPKE